MTLPLLDLKDITTPISATTRTILVPNAAALPDAGTLLPIRAVAQDTGKVYTIMASWVETDYTE